MSVSILGAGAFGTSLAIALAHRGPVSLWGRSASHMAKMSAARENTTRLAGAAFPDNLKVCAAFEEACDAETVLLAVPMQMLGEFLRENSSALAGKALVACCKGIDLERGVGPVELITQQVPTAIGAVLTGPSFARDIAKGLPTALSLACENQQVGAQLQQQLSTSTLRLYRTADVRGAQIGGALKNVMAIACGAVMGAGLGESARAAIMTRGFAEMCRFAASQGADPKTLAGLSGFGDLALTCTSEMSRNYQFGLALGAGEPFDETTTVEGAATSRAVLRLNETQDFEMPIIQSVAALVTGRSTVAVEMEQLLSRPLREE